ncbi:sigma-70 family RNA polymerase sigma factor [Streptomyces sp. NPDC006339]|uniref:sigma-70 family RNA polymerase sigma factor n=1 Tax=Streptomyces sp. NPDC006339 TaxID=3156755 RepID=UPI0033A6827A
MHDEQRTAALVEAARAGDARAGDDLVRACLPLVYNIVGRALDGHADVDDVVQETMVRALDGLTGLRDPARFRSWLVAIAMNRIRHRWRERQQAPQPGLDRAAALADPAGDFTDLTILRLGLTGQRREVAEATRWLDEDDRELLSLWWLEAAGELTRAELATALDLPPRHAAVRVQRMKARLETGRALVRALAAPTPCPGLAETTAAWDGRPSPLWRKRLARHLDACPRCAAGRAGLAPAEGLLVGLALVPPLLAGAGHGTGGADPATETAAWVAEPGPSVEPGSGAGAGGVEPATETAACVAEPGAGVEPGSGVRAGAGGEAPAVGGPPAGSGGDPAAGTASAPAGGLRAWGAGAVAVGVLGAAVLLAPGAPVERAQMRQRVVAAPTTPAPSTTTPTASPTPSPRPSRTRTPEPPSPEERLNRLVNRHRAAAGCGPLRSDPELVAVARAYGRDMVARDHYGHHGPDGSDPGTRMTAGGYSWSAWAENLARGQSGPESVVADWMADPPHRANLLNCRFRDTGVAAVPGPDGTIWVQELAAPLG